MFFPFLLLSPSRPPFPLFYISNILLLLLFFLLLSLFFLAFLLLLLLSLFFSYPFLLLYFILFPSTIFTFSLFLSFCWSFFSSSSTPFGLSPISFICSFVFSSNLPKTQNRHNQLTGRAVGRPALLLSSNSTNTNQHAQICWWSVSSESKTNVDQTMITHTLGGPYSHFLNIFQYISLKYYNNNNKRNDALHLTYPSFPTKMLLFFPITIHRNPPSTILNAIPKFKCNPT